MAAQCLREPSLTSESSLESIVHLAPQASFLIAAVTFTPAPALVPENTRLFPIVGLAFGHQGLLA